VLVFLFLLHPTLTQQIFQIFNCAQYGNGQFLATDLSISCDDAAYQRWRGAAIAMIMIYVVGIPATGFAIVFHYRKHLGDPSVKQRFRFLYEGYAKHAYFWEFIIIVRKVILISIVVFLKSQNFRSVLSGLWLLITALLCHVWVNPFVEPSLQLLETSALSVLLATLLFGLLAYAPHFSPGEQVLSIVAVLGLNVIMTVILVSILLYLYYNMISKNTKFNTLVAAVKRFLDSSKGQRNYDADQEELDEFADANSYYGTTSSADVTIDALRSGRSNFNLRIDSSDVNLANIRLGRSPRTPTDIASHPMGGSYPQ